MQEAVCKANPKTRGDLEATVWKIRDSFTSDFLGKCIDDRWERIQACIAAEGGRFEASFPSVKKRLAPLPLGLLAATSGATGGDLTIRSFPDFPRPSRKPRKGRNKRKKAEASAAGHSTKKAMERKGRTKKSLAREGAKGNRTVVMGKSKAQTVKVKTGVKRRAR